MASNKDKDEQLQTFARITLRQDELIEMMKQDNDRLERIIAAQDKVIAMLEKQLEITDKYLTKILTTNA
jgi:arsenate reductase-like glutaredoxin family protein